MTLTLVDPGGRRSSTARTMAPRLTNLTGLNIGLLSNGKANADALLNEPRRCSSTPTAAERRAS